ncbi:protein takeout-like [Ischnura elegans]|uniref:protein takeout-like n=1 Tax=Ischnura elegans TaxID=197161 RepID=UPI001ED8759B|nr:protein takeout-like [Ischnura elegans]
MYGSRFPLAIAAFALFIECGQARTVGNTFTICKTKDKDFQECFKESAVKALHTVLMDGVPEWGMVSLDPLFVPQLIISTGDGPVGFTLQFDNTSHTGMRTGRTISAKADPKNYKFDFEFKLPHYTVAGPYEAKGRIILLPITGKGLSNFTYHDVDAKWHIEGKPYTNSKGKTFMEPVKFDVTLHAERASIDLTNLFNGEKTLSDNMLKFLNENQKEFLSEFEPALNQAFSKLFLALAKQLFKKLPYNEMFPDL